MWWPETTTDSEWHSDFKHLGNWFVEYRQATNFKGMRNVRMNVQPIVQVSSLSTVKAS